MNTSPAEHILSIANESNQANKVAMMMKVNTALSKIINATLANDMKFGLNKVVKPTNYGTAIATEEQLVTMLNTIFTAKGNAKRRLIENYADYYDEQSITLIIKIVTGTLKIGIGQKLSGVNAFTVQLASEYSQKHHDKWNMYISEEKFDGMRVLVFIDESGKATALTRSGKPINTVDYILEELVKLAAQKFPGIAVVFDGEISTDSFNQVIHLIKRNNSTGSTEATYKIFDMLVGVTFDDFINNRLTDMTLLLRKKTLTKLFENTSLMYSEVVKYELFTAISSVVEYAQAFINEGKEGAVAKHPHSLYERKRAKNWFKIKNELSEDLRVIGYKEGTGKYEGMLGAIIVDYKGVSVSVGGGFTDDERIELWTNPEFWVMGRIAEIEFHQETEDGSLRHPRFKRFRDYVCHGSKE